MPILVDMAGQAPDITFRGEVWTDARGHATVSVPHDAYPEHASLDYVLQPIGAESGVRVTAELRHGRFSIETDEPHVKVAWQVGLAAATTKKGAAP